MAKKIISKKLCFDTYLKFINSALACKEITIEQTTYTVIKLVRHGFNDNNDWVFDFHLKSVDKEKHTLQVIWNEDRDFELTGVFFDGTHVDHQTIL